MNLSDSQQKIIDCKDPNIIVDAGSGSGKTRTLTEKVRCVLQSGVDPKSVVVITFTNLAADELRRRLVDVPNSDKCFIGTIHSYANHVLRKTGKKYDIYSLEYELEFMKILIPKYSRYCSIDDYTLLLRLRKQQESGKVKASEIPYRFTDVKVYKELLYLLGEEQNYQYTETVKTLCKLNNIITFDELLELSTKYFDDSKTVLDYLFVDELQDIGYLEYNFLMRLKSKHNFFIGDDYQAIYAFKGGDVNIFLSLMKNEDWTSFYLTENYRTAQSILSYANMIVQKSDNIIKKDYVCKNSKKGELKFETKTRIDNFIKSIPTNEDWMFLTRTNKELSILESIFKKCGVPYYCVRQAVESEEERQKILAKSNIKIMTVHKSKGLECDNVALYGKFPIKDTKDTDEYKVFYVGITRAKNKCCVFV